jgi:hypothetical protein
MTTETQGSGVEPTAVRNGQSKKEILLNAFDMSTVGHLSPGQWKVSKHCQIVLQEAKI